MAAPVPATPLIAWLQAVATANGKSFDVALANQSPDMATRGGPPNPPAPLAYPPPQGPPAFPPPPGPLPACSDRQHHNAAGPGASPCLSLMYNPQPHNAWPTRIIPTEVTCQHIGQVRGLWHGHQYNVCRNCLNNIWRQPWAIAIWADVIREPPAIARGNPRVPQPLIAPPGAAGPAWTRFMTRMCPECENFEMKVLQDNWNGMPGTMPAGAMIMTQRGESQSGPGPWAGFAAPAYLQPGGDCWPFVTCTCLQKWHENCTMASDVCIRHRHREACAKHEELLIIRAQNDQWLRELTRQNGQARKATPTATGNRARDGIYRACRCGRDIKRRNRPRVYQCLGCEGVIHLDVPVPLPNTAMPLPRGLPNAVTRHHTQDEPEDWRLRRPRAPSGRAR